MRTWAYLLGGLAVWAIHFFALYAASTIFLTSATTRMITALATFLCLAAAGALAAHGWRRSHDESEPDERWAHKMAGLSGATAFVAIAWQGLPALLI